jgi:hypothetical protein
MKVYTEEEIIRAIELSDGRSIDEVLAGLTPIELPSDEDIVENTIKPLHGLMDKWDQGFLSGAKWMRDKIIGGKK